MNYTFFSMQLLQVARRSCLIFIFAVLGSMVISITGYGQAKPATLTNKSILDMKSNGVPAGLIIRRITEAPNVNFDLSDAAIGQLSKAGVSEEIINKMLDKQNAASTTGAGTTASSPAPRAGASFRCTGAPSPLATALTPCTSGPAPCPRHPPA